MALLYKPLLLVLSAVSLLLPGCELERNHDSDKYTDNTVVNKSTVNDSSSNNDVITRTDFESFLKFKGVSPDDKARSDRMLEQFLERESLVAAIEKEGVLDKSMLDAELNEFRKETLIIRYFQSFLEDKASDIEVRNFYEANTSSYQQKRAKVAHILFRTSNQTDESDRSVKLTQTREVISRASAGEDFGLLAKEFSEDKVSSEKAGDIGWIEEGSIDPWFSEVVFSMEKGGISELVITPFGYHVIKLVDGSEVVIEPFEAVKGDIRYQLRSLAKDAELSRLKSLSNFKYIEKPKLKSATNDD